MCDVLCAILEVFKDSCVKQLPAWEGFGEGGSKVRRNSANGKRTDVAGGG